MCAPRRSLFANFELARRPIFAYNERMTITACAVTPAAPLSARISAALFEAPETRIVLALSLLRELVLTGAPRVETIGCWSRIGHLLERCAAGFDVEDWRRAYFTKLASQTRALWEAGREDLARPVRTVKRNRVIDATCTEVAS